MKDAIDALLIDMQERLAQAREAVSKAPRDQLGEHELLEVGRTHQSVIELALTITASTIPL